MSHVLFAFGRPSPFCGCFLWGIDARASWRSTPLPYPPLLTAPLPPFPPPLLLASSRPREPCGSLVRCKPGQLLACWPPMQDALILNAGRLQCLVLPLVSLLAVMRTLDVVDARRRHLATAPPLSAELLRVGCGRL